MDMIIGDVGVKHALCSGRSRRFVDRGGHRLSVVIDVIFGNEASTVIPGTCFNDK